MKKVLVISSIPTHPTNQGNKKCILTYMQMLSDLGYDTYLLLIIDEMTSAQELEETKSYWGDKLIIYQRKKIDKAILIWINRIHSKLFNNFPVDYLYPIGFSKFLKKIQLKNNFHAVIVNYIFLSKSFYSFPKNTKKLLYTHDSFTERGKKTGSNGFSVCEKEEAKALNRSDVILSIQEEESFFFQGLTNKQIVTCYTYFPLQKLENLQKDYLLFVASNNSHNEQGIRDFVTNALPEIRKKLPHITLLIGGSICSKISDLGNIDNLKLYGYIEDLTDFYKNGRVVINPVNTGTGFKIKSFEALSYGKALISHPHNTIGIYDKKNSPIIEAETPDEYANAISFLYLKNNIETRINESEMYLEKFNKYVSNCFVEAIERN